MLTRSRFGGFANENATANLKGTHVGLKKASKMSSVTTRSRSALGDIKNRGIDNCVQGNDKENLKEHFKTFEQKNKLTDMSIDQPLNECQQNENVIERELLEFRLRRKNIRVRCLIGENREDFIELDESDRGDVATVYPYVETIFNYLQNREITMQPLAPNFMSLNNDVSPRMRYILVNWLVQVHYSYKLQPETLYLCIALLDRYLLKNSDTITKNSFQLIGVTSLFIAAKFEEMYPPDINDFSSITNNTYSKNDIRNTEQHMLQSIDFYLSIPIPLVFLRRLSRCAGVDRTVHNLAKYLLELTIQEYDLCYLTGNLRAASALCLSRALCMETEDLNAAWPDSLSYLSGLTLDDLRPYIVILAKAAYRQNSPSKYRAIFNKYRADDFYGRVAALPQLRSLLIESLADLKFDNGTIDVE